MLCVTGIELFAHSTIDIVCDSFAFHMAELAERALTILHEWVQSESLRRHCYAVADSMKHFATLRGADADLWEAVGLLHDMDYERHPNQEQNPTEGHPFVGVAWLRERLERRNLPRDSFTCGLCGHHARIADGENSLCGG